MSIPNFDGAGDRAFSPQQTTSAEQATNGVHSSSTSPTKGNKKTVTFELHFEGAPDIKGRLPLRVGISPHDTTESIISVVKNFYGLYDHTISGISFEDKETATMLIPQFKNFEQDMHVVVKIIPSATPTTGPQPTWPASAGTSAHAAGLDNVVSALPSQSPQLLQQVPSRPSSRLARRQSASPKLGPAPGVPKSRSRPAARNAKASFQDDLDELNEAHNGYSSGDGAPGSVASSRIGATAEISVENIVEGGRRQHANFESSQLPLFAPPQVPAAHSISSVSPQRRSGGYEQQSPFERPAQKTFTWTKPLPSPQSYTFEHPQATSPATGGFQIPAVPKHGRSLRDRNSGASIITNRSSLGPGSARKGGAGILPTPDPTVASTISDEDVALQLMRLSDMSNFSHGRTSASAMDDAFSGRAEAASSASDDEEDTPLPTIHPSTEGRPSTKRKQNAVHELPSYDSIEQTGDEADSNYDASVLKSEFDDEDVPRAKVPKTKATARARGVAKSRPSKPPSAAKARTGSTSTVGTAASNVRKASTASTLTFAHQPGADEDDLSSKPRCQRCRKSKKGCDRQRPCGRCKDAGIGIEGCISEDEGNGRKGRYGRHMGVPVKKGSVPGTESGEARQELAAVQTHDAEVKAAGALLEGMAGAQQQYSHQHERQHQHQHHQYQDGPSAAMLDPAAAKKRKRA